MEIIAFNQIPDLFAVVGKAFCREKKKNYAIWMLVWEMGI